jgi:hypothetical protein
MNEMNIERGVFLNVVVLCLGFFLVLSVLQKRLKRQKARVKIQEVDLLMLGRCALVTFLSLCLTIALLSTYMPFSGACITSPICALITAGSMAICLTYGGEKT